MALRTSQEMETLRSDLRALQEDLREIARDVGELTQHAARGLRQRASSRGDWLGWAPAADLSSRRGREEALAELRARGQRSAEAIRSTVGEHPMTAALGALALGLAVAWLLTRPSRGR